MRKDRNHTRNLHNSLRTVAFAVVGIGAFVMVDPSFAQSSGPFAPLETAVQMIVDFITGPFGRLLAVIAVIGLGF